MADEEQAWRQYERYIYEKLKEWAGGQAEVEFDQELPGKFSGVVRQVDALITGRFAKDIERDVTAAVDCKRYSRNIDVTHVETFMGLVEDVQTDLGLLITSRGFSPAAKNRVQRGIKLHVVPQVIVAKIDELPRYHPAHDEAYYESEYFDHSPYGSVGATIRFCYVDNPEGYTLLPEELPWVEEVLASGETDELSWGDDRARRDCARIVLAHHLEEEPSDDVVEAFVAGIAADWEDGYPWVLYVGQLHEQLGV